MAVRSLGELTLDLVARTGGFTGPLDKAARHSRGRMQEIERSGRAAAAGISALSAAGAAAGAGILAYTNKAASSVRELKSQAQVANASTQEIQRLAYASQTVGVEQEKLSDIFKDVNDRVGQFLNEGNGEMALFFEKIAPQVGVTADEFARLSGPEALQLYYNSLEKAGLSQQQMTAYMEAMSDESTALIPLLKDGGAGFSDLADEADRLGIVLSDAQANALTDFAAQFDRVTGIMSAAGHVVAAELAPALSDLADELVEIAVAFQDGEYDQQLELLTNVGSVATGAAGAYAAYRSAIAAATLAQWAFNTAASANPVGALVTALGAGAGALFTFRDELGLTSSAAERAANRVDELTNAIDLSSEAAIKAQLVNLTGQTLALEQQATEARDALNGLGDASIDPGPFRQSMVLGADAGERREHYEALREAEEGLDANRAAADKLREQLKLLQESGVEPVDRSFKVFTEGTGEAAKAAEEAANQLSGLVDELYPLEALQLQYVENQQILTAAHDEGLISVERYRDALERLSTQYSADLTGGFMEQIDTGGLAKELENTSDIAEELGLTFTSAFEDAIVGGEGFRDVLAGIAEDVERILIRKSITEPAADAIAGFDWGSLVGSFFGGSAGGGGAGIFSGVLGGLYDEGGYTGPGGKYDPAGIVHAGEFVVQKSVVDQPGMRAMLEGINRGYASGGYVGGKPMPSVEPSGGGDMSVHIHNESGEAMEVSRQEQRRGSDGRQELHLWVNRIVDQRMRQNFRDGSMTRTMADSYGLRRRSR